MSDKNKQLRFEGEDDEKLIAELATTADAEDGKLKISFPMKVLRVSMGGVEVAYADGSRIKTIWLYPGDKFTMNHRVEMPT